MVVTPRSVLAAGLLCLVYAQSDNCGSSVVPLITRGRPVGQGEYPWLAALYQLGESGKWDQTCGGALISLRTVLTAAHCLVSPSRSVIDPNNIKVGLGKLYRNFYQNEDYSIIVNVTTVVVPERYLGLASSYALDVGLLKLAISVRSSNYILPVCLDFDTMASVIPGATVYAAGWGTSENGTSTDQALAADLSYLDYNSCIFQVRVVYRNYITHDKICALSINGSQVDRGDSGGALTYFKNGRHFVVGVVSTKIIDQTAFSIFTDLSSPEIHAWLLKQRTNLDEELMPPKESEFTPHKNPELIPPLRSKSCPPLESVSTTGNGSTFSWCFHGDTEINCSIPMPPTTIATYKCLRTGRDQVKKDAVTRRTLTCNPNGAWSNNQVPDCERGEVILRSIGKMKIDPKTITENGKCLRKFHVTGNGITDTFSIDCSNGYIAMDDGRLFLAGDANTDGVVLVSNADSTLIHFSDESCTENTYYNNKKHSTPMLEYKCETVSKILEQYYSDKFGKP